MSAAILFFCLALSVALPGAVFAQTTYTTIAAGDWTSPGTWDANGVPPNPMPSGDVADIDHAVVVTTTVTSSGLVLMNNVNAGFDILSAGTFNNQGEIRINLPGNSTRPNSGAITTISGVLSNSGIVDSQPTPNATSHRFQTGFGGVIDNLSGGLLDLQTVNQNSGTINNNLGATYRSGPSSQNQVWSNGVFNNDGMAELGGSFNIRETGIFNNQPTGVISAVGGLGVGFNGPSELNNLGTINISVGGMLTLYNTGSLTSDVGIISNEGTLTGDGPFVTTPANYSGDGRIFPNQIPPSVVGILDIQGSIAPAGELYFEILGTTHGTEYTAIDVDGDIDISGASIGARLNPGFGTNFDPAIGDEFIVVETTGAVIGTFAAENLPDLATGKAFEIVYEEDQVILRVFAQTT